MDIFGNKRTSVPNPYNDANSYLNDIKNLNLPLHISKNIIADPFNQLNSPYSKGSRASPHVAPEAKNKSVDIYNSMLQDDVKKFYHEREVRQQQKRRSQQTWANYLKF